MILIHFLINGKGEKASMSTYLHYVIAGNSATIQNSILDKTSYKKVRMLLLIYSGLHP